MPSETQCPNCQQSVEDGATFCGNCGFKLNEGTNVQQVYSNPVDSNQQSAVPAYAVPRTHHKQHWAAMALAFGLISIGGVVIAPIIGIVFGITGVVLATSSYRQTHGWLKPVSLIVPILALLLGVSFWVNSAVHNVKLAASTKAGTANGVATISVTTPCYSLFFKTELNVNNDSGSCTLNAYNGTTFEESSNVYKVIASKTNEVDVSNFDSFAKQAIESDVTKNLPNFGITNESASIFSGSPAYYVQAYDSSTNVATIEEAIFHSDPSVKDNFFVLIHAVNGSSTNLNDLESSWQWND